MKKANWYATIGAAALTALAGSFASVTGAVAQTPNDGQCYDIGTTPPANSKAELISEHLNNMARRSRYIANALQIIDDHTTLKGEEILFCGKPVGHYNEGVTLETNGGLIRIPDEYLNGDYAGPGYDRYTLEMDLAQAITGMVAAAKGAPRDALFFTSNPNSSEAQTPDTVHRAVNRDFAYTYNPTHRIFSHLGMVRYTMDVGLGGSRMDKMEANELSTRLNSLWGATGKQAVSTSFKYMKQDLPADEVLARTFTAMVTNIPLVSQGPVATTAIEVLGNIYERGFNIACIKGTKVEDMDKAIQIFASTLGIEKALGGNPKYYPRTTEHVFEDSMYSLSRSALSAGLKTLDYEITHNFDSLGPVDCANRGEPYGPALQEKMLRL